MSVKWEKTGKTTGELTFDISKEEVKLGLDEAFKRIKRSLNVPGFRKGHVSRTIFDQFYGEEALYQDALNFVLPNAYSAALKEAKIKAVGQPQVSPVSMDKGQAWTMKATVTTEPEVKLGKYKGIEVPRQNTRVYAKDVDAEIERRRQANATLVLKKGEAAKGDTVTIDFEGTIDGKKFDGGSAKNHSLQLGSGSFIPGFEDQLIGHKAGDKVDVVVTFPKDYGAKDLAGKEAHFATTLHEIKTKQLPKLDDEFAKDVDESVDTLDQLKDKIKDQLKARKEDEAEDAIQAAAMDGVIKNAKIDEIPDAMIQQDVDNQLNQYLGNLRRQGIDPQTYFQITKTDEATLRKQIAAGAEDRVKTSLVLEAIVKAEKLTATKEEKEQEIKDLASEYNMDVKTVRETLTDDMLEHDIAVRKAMDMVTDNAKQVSKAEYEKANGTDKDAKKSNDSKAKKV
ncbi:MAG: trigger factor [Lactobacillus sp.]|jgi:trigger factor|nr:trigger factor [Lactobacillus sp.]